MKKLFIKLTGCLCVFAILICAVALIPKNSSPLEVSASELIEEKQNFEDVITSCQEISITENTLNEIFAKNIEMTDSIMLFEKELEKSNTNIVDIFNAKIESYKDMILATNSNEDKDKIQKLINATHYTSLVYQRYNERHSNDTMLLDTDESVSPAYVATIVAGLIVLGYDLAAELLNTALSNKNPNGYYVPVFGGRVVTSQVFYDIVDGSSPSGDARFSNSGSRNERDLYYALRKFRYQRATWNSKYITITDPYDYDIGSADEDGGEVGGIIEKMYQAQLAGVIVPYEVRINVDASKFVRIDVISKTNGKWNIKVTNPGNSDIQVFYNSKMCLKNDSRLWTGLTDIVSKKILANSYETVVIEGNGAATDITFSQVIGSSRYITCADEINADGNNISKESYIVNFPYYENIGIVGKNGNAWKIRVTNTFGERVKIEYNSKMCFEDDAKNWSVKNVSSFYLSAGSFYDFPITENGFATHIAVRFSGFSSGSLVYAKDLNADGTMTICDRVSFPVFNYLGVSNSGKNSSGLWRINITNPLETSITVYYNKKMCFENDAKNWSGLSNEEQFSLSGNSTKQVTIQTNFFATCIAISYFYYGKRYITYGNSLGNDGSIKIMYSII